MGGNANGHCCANHGPQAKRLGGKALPQAPGENLLRKWHTHLEAWILEQAGIDFSTSEQQERLRLVK